MDSTNIAHLRLANQRLVNTEFTTPYQVVKWMGCIQAQDYGMAKWAIGCRMQQATDTEVEKDFNEGKIIRTHVLRPTWHFVCPEDIRWMLKLSAPRIRTFARPYLKQLEIDPPLLKKSRDIIIKALDEHKKLTRPQLTERLKQKKIDTTDSRMGHLLMDAELDGLICSAGRIGRQFAYGLLDELVPKSPILTGEEAILELGRRYFLSRSPATIQDFAWWAGITIKDASICPIPDNPSPPQSPAPSTLILPAFDEYAVSYKNRNDILDPKFAAACSSGLKPIIVHNGRIIGTWQPLMPFGSRPPVRAITAAIRKYSAFKQ